MVCTVQSFMCSTRVAIKQDAYLPDLQLLLSDFVKTGSAGKTGSEQTGSGWICCHWTDLIQTGSVEKTGSVQTGWIGLAAETGFGCQTGSVHWTGCQTGSDH